MVPKFRVRTTSDCVDVVARAAHRKATQVSDVSVVHDAGTASSVHAVPASWVTSTVSNPPGAATARQSSPSVHDRLDGAEP